MSVAVRPRHRADLPALADALVAVHSVDAYPVEGVADPRGWLESSDGFRSHWTALLNDVPAGNVSVADASERHGVARLWAADGGDVDDLLCIVRLFVHPDARGHGLARRLMAAATDWIRAQNKLPALDVMTKDVAAIALYEATGWQRTGTFTHTHSGGRTHPGIALVQRPPA